MSTPGKTRRCRPVVLLFEFTFRQFYELLEPVGIKQGFGLLFAILVIICKRKCGIIMQYICRLGIR